jgi:hypothetical protein
MAFWLKDRQSMPGRGREAEASKQSKSDSFCASEPQTNIHDEAARSPVVMSAVEGSEAERASSRNLTSLRRPRSRSTCFGGNANLFFRLRTKSWAVLSGALLLLLVTLNVPPAQADFGLKSMTAAVLQEDESVDLQAGSHPYEFRLDFEMNQKGFEQPAGTLRQFVLDLPAGMVGNPVAIPRCPAAENEGVSAKCSGDTQIGVANVVIAGIAGSPIPIYNLSPPLGVAARIGFSVASNNVFNDASLRPDDYGVRVSDLTIPTSKEILSVDARIWGVPAAPAHDPDRLCLGSNGYIFGCPATVPPVPFLSMPTSCGDPLRWSLSVSSVEEPESADTRFALSESEGTPTGLEGCNALEFDPSISSQPTTNLSDSPSGLDFDLHIPQPPAVEQEAGSPDVCFRGVWSGEPTAYEFQWLRNGAPIPGATSPAYQLQAADAGTALQCEVHATNGAAGPGRAISPPLVISPQPSTAPPTAGRPAIKVSAGTATCDPGKWGGTPSFAYQWFEDGALLPGQSENTYSPGPAPYTLQCQVSATNAGGTVLAYSANRTTEPPLEPALPEASLQPRASLDEDALPLATAHLRDTTIVLPEGMGVNPASAAGLEACSEAEIGYAPAAGGVHFDGRPQSCPDAAKIASVEVRSPLVDHVLPDASGLGAVYLAEPYRNPFGTLLAIYLVVEDHQTGVIAKLAGKVTPDPATGRLTTSFEENPQLPFEDFEVHFFKGSRGTLRTPLACGTHTTTSTLVPWSSPEGADAIPADSFQTSVAAAGSGPCPQSEAEAPHSPTFRAGNISPQAGAYAPFVLELTRPDGSQRLARIDTTLPPGLAGKIAGIAPCPEAAIAAAKAREAPDQGALEIASPSCPPASELGTVTVAVGAGPNPYYVGAHAYLAGPYRSAPLSMVVIAPAVSGPFDLGTVVSRVALRIDPQTAQISALSDPLPTILEGVELDVRQVAIDLDRPGFTLNPTSCEELAITGTATSTLGQAAPLSQRFQLGGCGELGFRPRLSLRLKGPVKRTANPKLIATLRPRPGEANVSFAQVKLPPSAFLDNSHIRTICTRVQFNAGPGNGAECPPGSIYGRASATTPLLDYPLSGTVFLRASDHPLPDLVVAFSGPPSQPIHFALAGRTDSVRGALRNTFETAPDVPVSKFRLELFGGERGLVEMSSGFCRHRAAAVKLKAHNGARFEANPKVQADCPKRHRHRRGR